MTRMRRQGSMRNRRRLLALSGLAVFGFAAVTAASSPVTATAQSDSFVKGNGSASAAVVSVVPKAGPLALPIRVGQANATYDNVTGVGEAHTLNLGFFKTILTSEICNFTPVENSEDLPSPTRVDSNASDAVSAEHEPGESVEGSTLPKAGYEKAEAKRNALGYAMAKPAALLDLGVLSIDEGIAESRAELIPGERRTAVATSELGSISLAGGLVRLAGLRWEARQESSGPPGTPPDIATGTFSGRLQAFPVLGKYTVDVPIEGAESLKPLVETLNKIIGPGFLTVHLPELKITPESGAVEMTPLILRFIGGEAVAPLFGDLLSRNANVVEIRRQAIKAIKGGECEGEEPNPRAVIGDTTDLVSGILASGLQGNGGIDIELGGATAKTQAKTFEDPFGSRTPRAAPPRADTPTGTGTTGSGGISVAPTARTAAPAPAPAPTGVGPLNTSTVGETGPTRCLSVHPKEWPGCSSGRAGLAITLAALTAGGLIAGDVMRSQRRRLRTRQTQGASA